ncbi:hypothetical protein AJ85_21175 [Alkalihalobacillus alcalophilus ATCC 27647 = CGMCC 1.3604]|uniref:Chorismate dehydratase n=1 Tax=Alkalihalobacillus alcalophilus ATCC 27647 = CGMCC 1.3604 TaxID=1218173 RepID=A0A094Z000_ALKAL|nr:menaquinone biosynthesis protein [Alkalihalobacillus alcalophilus]KGA99147.1 hypothetical protein BALCAV_0200385 [Alkalihalobacillus alcalophilus ATCC 27647 = CGMCC 1.3604]MED1560494.1 menaquinone biosynthesis protein [Alkalihalobacillus alcalophilus]THG92033.1 hypothetical protein AJ85_21175 [Alkalihalobacillus alcalophilus ATCC 27647 = CGMCC 1.3604]
MTLRIGEISYTNILPLFYFVDRDKLKEEQFTFIPQVPAQLNAAMSKAEVDVGGISSFAYAKNQHDYTLLPDLSVSSYHAVGSLFLFSKVPIEQLNEKRIALTSSSATTIHLLKVILAHFYQFKVHYEVEEPNYDKMLAQFDACLLIGDDAIKATWCKEPNIYQYDLGELWYQFTGLPMTFAVIAVRNEIVETKVKELELLNRELLFSKEMSIQTQFQPMIRQIMKDHAGDLPFWSNYFNGLTYDFSEAEQKGLLSFYDLCYQLGYLNEPVETLKLWQPVKDKLTK